MHPLAETLLDEPVIAAVKTDEALTAALASPCSAVFLLASTLLTVDGLVHRIHDAGKLAVVHIDLVAVSYTHLDVYKRQVPHGYERNRPW